MTEQNSESAFDNVKKGVKKIVGGEMIDCINQSGYRTGCHFSFS